MCAARQMLVPAGSMPLFARFQMGLVVLVSTTLRQGFISSFLQTMGRHATCFFRRFFFSFSSLSLFPPTAPEPAKALEGGRAAKSTSHTNLVTDAVSTAPVRQQGRKNEMARLGSRRKQGVGLTKEAAQRLRRYCTTRPDMCSGTSTINWSTVAGFLRSMAHVHPKGGERRGWGRESPISLGSERSDGANLDWA